MKRILSMVLIILPLLMIVGVVYPQGSDQTSIRPLDFSPFEASLDGFEANRLAAVHDIAFEADIQDIQQAFENGDLTAVELTLYYLSRIRQYDAGQLRAVLELNPEALDIAQMLDDERANGNLRGPLHGIPVLIKDNIGTGDMLHTTAGAMAMMDARSDRDAFLVTKLRDAGAIILGKANLSEWANFISSRLPNGFSALGGQVVNPYGENFDPFGSSTGSAVSVSANFVTVAVGTETMGSIISPSVANSVVGMYPSIGLISRDRIIRISEFMDMAGPIARNVSDLAALLTVLAGPDESDPRTADAAELEGTDFTTYLDENALQGKRVVVLMQSGMNAEAFVRLFLTEEVEAAFINAGAELIFAMPPRAQADVFPVFIYGMQTGVDAYLAETSAPIATIADIVALNEENEDLYIPYGQDLLRRVADNSRTFDEIAEIANQNRTVSREALLSLLSDNDADVIVALGFEIAGVYAPAGFPGITVPGGYRSNGEPFGITFVGDYLSDGELIGYAYAFEQASHFRQPPPIGSD
ncbi:MAG: amidase [Chloroflexi bacterium]|nr:amidase [Chloroflexota bacterium]